MKPTVFVVGAGASAEFGLRTGLGLAAEIRELLRSRVSEREGPDEFGHPFYDAIRPLTSDHSELLAAADTIRRGLPFSNSIDDFLHENRDNELVVRLGKISIAHCLTQHERESGWLRQLSDSRITARAQAFDQLRSTWLDALFRLLKRGYGRRDARAAFANVSFIVFNYDRCIEQFLRAAVPDALDLSPEEGRNVTEAIRIEHVYGSLGSLPVGPGDGLEFGPEFPKLASVAQGIKTYTEEVSGTSRTILSNMISEAEQIAFLGYAFHEQGMKLLFPEDTPRYAKAFWTRLNVHDAVNARLTQRFTHSGKYGVNLTCAAAIPYWQFELME